jgi:hypothetical protein
MCGVNKHKHKHKHRKPAVERLLGRPTLEERIILKIALKKLDNRAWS